MQRQLVGNAGSQLQDPQGQEGSRAPSYTAQACHIPALPAPIPDQGLTVGRLLWVNKLCQGAGQAGGQRCWCTGPIRVPGLTAVVAELGATSLTPTGEARTLGTAIGNDSVAVGRRQSAWGDQQRPQAPCHIPARHTVTPLPRTDRLCTGRSQICVAAARIRELCATLISKMTTAKPSLPRIHRIFLGPHRQAQHGQALQS